MKEPSEARAATGLLGRLEAALRSDAAWFALWSAPLWSSVFGRVLKPRTAWLVDFNSVVCAAERMRANLPFYTLQPVCPTLRMSTYVYPPWVARSLVAPVGWFGERGVVATYAVVFAGSFAFLLWAAFGRAPRRSGVRDPWAWRRDHAPFLAFVTGSPIVVGNIAVIAQAAIVAAGLWLGAESLGLTALIVVASLIKPIYLTFLAIPAYAAAAASRRIALVVVAAAITVGLVASNLSGMAEWRAFVVGVAVDPNPGGGLLRWLGDAGVQDHRTQAVAYLVYAAAVFLAGLAIAERGRLDASERMWLGASVGVLLLPRLVAYDLLILGPGLLAAVTAARALSVSAAARLRALWLAACLIYLAANLGGGALRFGHTLSLVLLAGGLVGLGVALMRRTRVGPT